MPDADARTHRRRRHLAPGRLNIDGHFAESAANPITPKPGNSRRSFGTTAAPLPEARRPATS